MSSERHWDELYEERGPEAVSWYQPSPEASLALIDAVGLAPDRSVIDVGGGASPLVDELMARGFADVTVLDISEVALERSRERLGAAAQRVRWICADVRDWTPNRTYDLWHDRAVFHFLVDGGDRERYLRAATLSLEPGAHLVVGTFSPAAPPHCSGLPVSRYSAACLARTFGAAFSLLDARDEHHITPRGKLQPFTWALFQRVSGGSLRSRLAPSRPALARQALNVGAAEEWLAAQVSSSAQARSVSQAACTAAIVMPETISGTASSGSLR
jgi:SAM-dependent methyltransferase